jgi:hypothetical protein
MKKIDFMQFGTVLARMALKIYVDPYVVRSIEQTDPLEYTLKFIGDYLFSLNGSSGPIV